MKHTAITELFHRWLTGVYPEVTKESDPALYKKLRMAFFSAVASTFLDIMAASDKQPTTHLIARMARYRKEMEGFFAHELDERK